MDLIEFIVGQGVSVEDARDLALKKSSEPHLVSCTLKGKFISLVPKSQRDTDKANEMIACGIGPYLNTDAVFMQGTANGCQFEMRPEQGEYYKQECEKRGGTTLGRKYFSSLARFPGDPEAFIEGRGDVAKLLSSRGWGSDGAVKMRPVPICEVPNPVDIASDIVDREVAKIAGSERLNQKQESDLREKIKDRITPEWKKKKKKK